MGANYLSSVFSQNMQKTFTEYISEKRMEKAKKLLKSTELPTSEIAAQVGYKDPHYFSFVFKKTQGAVRVNTAAVFKVSRKFLWKRLKSPAAGGGEPRRRGCQALRPGSGRETLCVQSGTGSCGQRRQP